VMILLTVSIMVVRGNGGGRKVLLVRNVKILLDCWIISIQNKWLGGITGKESFEFTFSGLRDLAGVLDV